MKLINWIKSKFKKKVSVPVEEQPKQESITGKHKINQAGLDLIKHWEGFYPNAYQDSVGVWTIGWGTIKLPSGVKVFKGMFCTKEQASEWLEFEVNEKSQSIVDFINKIGLELNENQFSALVSLTYNLGTGIITQPWRTMNSALKSKDHHRIADAFLVYNKAGGKTLRGLTNRRIAERELYLKEV